MTSVARRRPDRHDGRADRRGGRPLRVCDAERASLRHQVAFWAARVMPPDHLVLAPDDLDAWGR